MLSQSPGSFAQRPVVSRKCYFFTIWTGVFGWPKLGCHGLARPFYDLPSWYPLASWQEQHTWLCKQTRCDGYLHNTNKQAIITYRSKLSDLQRRKVAKEEKNGQDENGKIFIHNSLASIMLYYTHIIMFRKVSHLSYALTGHCLWSSKKLVVSPWWRRTTPPSTRWNLLCIINVLYFTTLCSQVALQVPWSIKFSYAAALWKQAIIMAHW